ncbi:MAG: hypothetical protein N3F66_14705 [Spirochaetes bacterium]|nr:hypothetical protein [Spirochaetota bacterium]
MTTQPQTRYYNFLRDIVVPGTISIIFFLLGTVYSITTPLWVPPDEERHFAYCEYIAQHHQLPALVPSTDGIRITEATHPPLYYILASFFCNDDGRSIHEVITVNDGPGYRNIVHAPDEEKFPYSGKARSAHLIRLFSLLLATVTVVLIYHIALIIFSGDMLLATSAAIFAATNAQFIHIAASVSNETLAAMFSAMIVYVLLGYFNGQFLFRTHVITGFLLGCGLLTKITTAIFIPITYAVVFYTYTHKRKNPIRPLFVISALSFFISGWWYIRNWIFYNDPTFANALIQILPFTTRNTPITTTSVMQEVKILFISFFGYFGALQIPITSKHLFFYGMIMASGIVGICRFYINRHNSRTQKKLIGLLLLTFFASALLIATLNVRAYVFMGKYLFIALAPIAVLVCAGIHSLIPQRFGKIFFLCFSILLVVVNIDIFFRILMPAVTQPHVAVMIEQPEFCCRTPELVTGTTIGQTFLATQNKLCAIRVMLNSHKHDAATEVLFTLFEEGSTNAPLIQILTTIENITDTRYFFIFPPLHDSLNKKYTFKLTALSKKSTGIYLWHTDKDAYSGGNMMWDDKGGAGDLFFTAYYFTGINPCNIWEGTHEVVIRQGEYISVRELQIYVEMPHAMQEKTQTYQKMMRIKNVYNF